MCVREQVDLADAQSSVGTYYKQRIGRDKYKSEQDEIDEFVLCTHHLSMRIDIDDNNKYNRKKLLKIIQEYSK